MVKINASKFLPWVTALNTHHINVSEAIDKCS